MHAFPMHSGWEQVPGGCAGELLRGPKDVQAAVEERNADRSQRVDDEEGTRIHPRHTKYHDELAERVKDTRNCADTQHPEVPPEFLEHGV